MPAHGSGRRSVRLRRAYLRPLPWACGLALALAWPLTGASGFVVQIDGGTSFGEGAIRIAVDPAGDLLVLGTLQPGAPAGPRLVALVKLAGANGQTLWTATAQGGSTQFGAPHVPKDLAVDSAGDAVVVGRLLQASGATASAIRFRGSDGAELWRTDLQGTDPSSSANWLNAVALGPAGDVFATGLVDNGTSPAGDLIAVRLSAADGSVLWRTELSGPDPGSQGLDIALDPAGAVVVAGGLSSVGGEGTDFAVIKLDAADGSEIWRSSLDGTFSGALSNDFAEAVATDANGDVIAVGRVLDAATLTDILVAKFSGSTGSVLWRTQISGPGAFSGDDGLALAVDPTGDVHIAGKLEDSATGLDFYLARLSGSDGSILWQRQVDGGPLDVDSARSIVLDPSGRTLAAGSLESSSGFGENLAVVALDSATGSELWRTEMPGSGADLALFANDDVAAAGSVFNSAGTDANMLVARLSGLDGSDPVGLAGDRLIAVDKGAPGGLHKLLWIARDPLLPVPARGAPDDPRTAGARFHVFNPDTGERVSLEMPAAGWQPLGTDANPKGFKYLDKTGALGPCKVAVVKAGKLAKVLCLGKLGSIPFTLDEAAQGRLAGRLHFGTGLGASLCTDFGGTLVKDQSTADRASAVFKALRAPAPAPCPNP